MAICTNFCLIYGIEQQFFSTFLGIRYLALGHAKKANEEAEKNLKRYGDRICELQQQIEDKQRRRNDFQERFLT